MVSRKTKRKNFKQFALLICAVVVLVGASIVFQNWWKSRPGPDPKEITITAKVGNRTVDVTPYSICELDAECEEKTVTTLDVQENDTLSIEVPESISDHDWSLLTIYDDPTANDQFYYGANEQSSVDIAGSVKPQEGKTKAGNTSASSHLLVAEVSSVFVAKNAQGEETAYTVTWSINTENAQKLTAETTPAPAQTNK
ncbi:DUF2771 domain-containing protein [Corynebacterium sp. sy039]|uniref:DUF2771 domain-containing protein n=1 Tax=Corynebacterium sp. sy039 TaxID=2599641 RepID=UPI0011B47404|nr:DUF2771 domain-containing protein [Corynebacterium sp. sy039]QDZ42185.1 DUF2771 domain-containing protein [Corynebacterium sp. sy039]